MMCKELCDADDYGTTCPDCGRMICWDVKSGDDIVRPAYATASGDLYCDYHGRQHDEAEEQGMEEEWDYDPEEQIP